MSDIGYEDIPEPEAPSAEDIAIFILPSIKKMIGIPIDDTSFDVDIIFNINDALSTMYQLGCLSKPFSVKNDEDSYDDAFPGQNEAMINKAKMYLYHKVKYGFDTNTMTSANLSSLERKIKEDEWRLMTFNSPEGVYE